MSDQIFSDGVGSVVIIGGTVRLDLVVLSPTEKEPNGQPKTIHQQRIIMGAENFIRSAARIQEAAQALSKHIATHALSSVLPQSSAPDATAQGNDKVSSDLCGSKSPSVAPKSLFP